MKERKKSKKQEERKREVRRKNKRNREITGGKTEFKQKKEM